MEEAESRPLRRIEGLQVSARRFQQAISPPDVGRDKFGRAVDRPVDMGFSREIDNRTWPMLRQKCCDQRGIADVAGDENVLRLAGSVREVVEIACIRELIQIDHGAETEREPIENEISADKSGAPGHENGVLAPRVLGVAERGNRATLNLHVDSHGTLPGLPSNVCG